MYIENQPKSVAVKGQSHTVLGKSRGNTQSKSVVTWVTFYEPSKTVLDYNNPSLLFFFFYWNRCQI